jgi:LEA14-like dessication related protein
MMKSEVTKMIVASNYTTNDQRSTINNGTFSFHPKFIFGFAFLLLSTLLTGCGPKEKIELRKIKDVVVDGTTEPMLKAQAIFYNPNNMRMKLRRINVDVYVNEKKVANINQELKMLIPAKGEFTIPLEVKLAMKELGLMDTILGFLGGRKFNVEYKGSIRLNYHGIPIRVPVKYKDEIRIRF